MRNYKVIFFDLDHTLWDYEKNSTETLTELFYEYKLSDRPSLELSTFLDTFEKVNAKMWSNFNKGHIDREVIRNQRFKKIFKVFNIRHDIMARKMSEDYIVRCPVKTHLLPHAKSMLEYLKPRYDLYVLTNGFDDVQSIKMATAQLDIFFKGVITSESSGHRKPSSEIFNYSLEVAMAKPEEAIMIGDNLNADMAGAKNANIDHIFFNPARLTHQQAVTYEINCLSQLSNIL